MPSDGSVELFVQALAFIHHLEKLNDYKQYRHIISTPPFLYFCISYSPTMWNYFIMYYIYSKTSMIYHFLLTIMVAGHGMWEV
jgi:hypothetical protein